MILNRSTLKISATELIVGVLSLLYLIGIRVWFPVCPVMSEMIMSCHWAGAMLKALSVLLFVLSVVHMLVPDWKIQLGMDLAMLGAAALTACVPGGVIRLCADAGMACRHNTQPWNLAFCAAMLLALLADLFFLRARIAQDAHRRT